MQWLYNTITRLLLAIIVSLLLISIILSYVSKVGHAKALARVASAAEINYGSVQKAEGGRLIIKYSGPAGEITFSCDLTGSCAPFSEIAAALPMGTKIAESEDGRYVLGVLNVHAGAVFYSYYSLYERSGGTYVFKALLPIYEPTLSIRFAPANSALVFATISGRLGSYNISTGQSFTAQTSQREFPFLTFSQNGKYASFYNYVSASHKVWDLESKTSREIKGKPSLIEFNSGATLAVYADDESGYDNVYSSVPGSGTTAPLISGQFTVADYAILGEKLYYIANENHALEWNLYALDPSLKIKEKIADNVSYGEPLRTMGDSVIYGKVEGKNLNIAVYNAVVKNELVLRPVDASVGSISVKKEIVKLSNGKDVVVWSNGLNNDSSQNMFVWLHGGPQRQTSLNYHPYLSYAVYDELLEKLVSGGALVLKVDYAGSYGYGKNFIESLNGNVGRADVNDVINAVSEIKKSKNVQNVYLIGNSYGGYLSLKGIVENPSLFQGAISINGLPDWFSLAYRIPSSPLLKLFYGLPGAYNIHNYLQASIHSKISALTNQKMLIIYGEDDTTVPVWQSKEFYNFARAFGKNAELVAYAGEDHVPKKRVTLNDICAKIVSSFDLSGVNCN